MPVESQLPARSRAFPGGRGERPLDSGHGASLSSLLAWRLILSGCVQIGTAGRWLNAAAAARFFFFPRRVLRQQWELPRDTAAPAKSKQRFYITDLDVDI